MHVFVTGATGFVGSAVVKDLIAHGHTVTGLARSDDKAAALAATGAKVRRGVMEDLDGLREAAADADAVIHTAFNHDFSRFLQNCEDDRRAIEALGAGLEGSDKPLLVTSGLARLAPQGRPAVESDTPPADTSVFPRQSETAAAALRAKGVRAGAVRLPPSTHGVGDKGFMAILAQAAQQAGRSVYLGDGANRRPATHRLDAAPVFRLALEHGAVEPAYHAVAEEGVPMRDIAEALGRILGLPTVSVGAEEAQAHFGWFAMFATADMPASGRHTRELLGWTPKEVGLIADLQHPGYLGA